jgi:hypothetical protein
VKTAQLPPVRVEPSAREEIEAVLREGESLSEFVETAAVQAARQRKAQQEFLARGRASEDLQRLEDFLFEILSEHEMAVSAIRHQREDDYH